MPDTLEKFVKTHFFSLQKAEQSTTRDPFAEEKLQNAFAKSGLSGQHWREHLEAMQAFVGSPIKEWHAGHLAVMKGETLPTWAKRDTYIKGFGTALHLEELQRQAANTMAQMKFALIQEALKGHALMYDTDIQEKMKMFLREMREKSMADPLVFLGHVAYRRFGNDITPSNKPSHRWSKNEKSTELICQLASLTYLQIQASLQSGNNIEQKNVPTSAVADISMP